jgi:hypothetical protein
MSKETRQQARERVDQVRANAEAKHAAAREDQRKNAASRLRDMFKRHGHRLVFVQVNQTRDTNGNTLRFYRVFAGACSDVTHEVLCILNEYPREFKHAGYRRAIAAGPETTTGITQLVSMALFFDSKRIQAVEP